MNELRALAPELDWQALFVGFVVGYCVPVLLACVMPVSLWLLWFWTLAPIGAGYVAAKLASRQPLLHGVAASALGLVVFGLISSPRSAEQWVVWSGITLACGFFGAWLWRRHDRRAVSRRS